MTTTIEPALFTHETPLTQFDDDLRETIIGRLCDFELVHVDQEDSQVLSEIYKVWVPVVLEDLSEERALLVFQQFYNRNPKQEVDSGEVIARVLSELDDSRRSEILEPTDTGDSFSDADNVERIGSFVLETSSFIFGRYVAIDRIHKEK